MRKSVGAFLLPALVVGSLATGGTLQRPTPPITVLTVPAERLPEGCALASVNAADRITGISRSIRAGQPPPPVQNPWIGTDRTLLGRLRQFAEQTRSPRVPDALPLTRADEQAMLQQYADGVTEGYAAIYSGDITVTAVRFSTTPEILLPPAAPPVDLGAIRVMIRGDGPCRAAIESYIRSL